MGGRDRDTQNTLSKLSECQVLTESSIFDIHGENNTMLKPREKQANHTKQPQFR